MAEGYETSVGGVADRYSLAKTQVFTWRRDLKHAGVAQVIVEDAEPEPAVAYVYAPDRKAERQMAHLTGFTGVLEEDGHGG